METQVLTKEVSKIQEKTKVCFKCGEIKSLSGFYKHSKMGDGHLNKCKECTKADTKKNYRKNIDYYKDYEHKRATLPHRIKARSYYQKTDQGRKAHNRANSAYRRRYPQKKAAHTSLDNAIRDRKIKRQPCFICGAKEVHGHHYDYSKPLSVIWLCPEHHLWMHHKRAVLVTF